jgi:hypothetical protein
VQSPALRTAILGRFDDPRFEVTTALQKQSIVDEPRFFTPDIVFIEDQLCLAENGERFDLMMKALDEQCTVLIFGKHEAVAALRRRHFGRRIVAFHKIPKNLAETVLTRFRPAHDGKISGLALDACHINAESPYSLAELTFAARLTRVHPHAAGVALPHIVGDFALCRLESPLLRKLLGRNPYMKFTATYSDGRSDHGGFPYLADGYLADLDQGERQALSQGLVRLMTEHLARFDTIAPASDAADTAPARTPELGTAAAAPRAPIIPQPPVRAVKAVSTAPIAPTPTAAVASPPAAVPASAAPAVASGNAAVASAAESRDSRSVYVLPADRQDSLLKERTRIERQERLERLERIGTLERFDKLAVRDESDAASRLNIVPASERRAEQETDILAEIIEGLTSRTFLEFVGYTALIAFVCAMLWALFTVVAPSWEKSGAGYSEQLKKFAPHLNAPHRQEQDQELDP